MQKKTEALINGAYHLVLDASQIIPDDPGAGTPAMVYGPPRHERDLLVRGERGCGFEQQGRRRDPGASPALAGLEGRDGRRVDRRERTGDEVMNKLLGHTHYLPTKAGMSHLFTLGKCENCGGDVQEANSVLAETKACRIFRLVLATSLPVEVCWSEEKEMSCCESCY